MEVKVVTSEKKESEVALEEILLELKKVSPPDFMMVYLTVEMDSELVRKTLAATFPEVPFIGASSCLGFMTNGGFHSNEGCALGVFAIYDKEGSYGYSLEEGSDPCSRAKRACEISIERAGRTGELPDFIWILGAPGCEEEYLRGIREYLGAFIPIFGGSCADNDISGKWVLFDREKTIHDGVIITSIYSGAPPVSSFHCGYEPTSKSAVVTRAENRQIISLNDEPASTVYNNWTDGLLDRNLQSGENNIVAQTTLFPLGRKKASIGGLPYYLLSHPDSIVNKSRLSLFTQIYQGEEVVLMRGNVKALQERAAEVVRALISRENLKPSDIAGALIVYCAGCMLTVRSQMGMDLVIDNLNSVIGNVPMLGIFTFGEQGCFLEEENLHGNLMISATLFLKQ